MVPLILISASHVICRVERYSFFLFVNGVLSLIVALVCVEKMIVALFAAGALAYKRSQISDDQQESSMSV